MGSFFRFCDLPKDIRLLIYEEYFSGTRINIGESARFPYTTLYCEGSNYTPLKNAPALLRVNKLIREESLEIFFKSTHSCLVRSTRLLPRVPAVYLNHVKEVWLTNTDHLEPWGRNLIDTDMQLFAEGTFPSLQLLRIMVTSDEWCLTYGELKTGQDGIKRLSKAETYQNVINLAKDEFEGCQLHIELEKRRSVAEDQLLPFRIMLELEDAYYIDPWTGWQGSWKPLVIDWQKQEIVEEYCCWPPPEPEMYEVDWFSDAEKLAEEQRRARELESESLPTDD